MADYGTNFRAPRVDVHQFSMIPRADIPRSTFSMQHQHKTTLDAAKLYPIYVQEILPGDTFNVSMTAFARLQTTIYPVMDNMDIESWFFFVPARIIWSHWVNFMGEQPSGPADSISYTIPQVVSPVAGFPTFTIYDYMGIPGVGQIGGGNTLSVNALPFRAYNKIYNEWFRDQNLTNAVGYGATNTVTDIGDGPDPQTNYTILTTTKRHDYFTSCLPWTQKGAAGAVTLPLGTSATVKTSGIDLLTGAQNSMRVLQATAGAAPTPTRYWGSGTATATLFEGTSAAGGAYVPTNALYPSNLYADLSTATAATINQLRLAFQTQRLLERDARGGTRYTEIIRSHFQVSSPDQRLQRPEYLGGGKTPVNIAPVAQTTATGLTGGTSPLGTLAGVGTAVARSHGFRGSFTEHGYILGLVAIRADQIYQQGLRRLWTRSTRYDFYFPVFAMLGEQGVRNDEIYTQGAAADTTIFGYQERWAEYRYFPSMVTGSFKSYYATPLDAWHLANKFTALPTLNNTFITDTTNTVLTRALAAGAAANNQQFLLDLFFNTKCARPMPMYSVPGMIDHF